MKIKISSFLSLTLVLCLLGALLLTFAGCKSSSSDKGDDGTPKYTDLKGNPYDPPTDNDFEGWFSVEQLSKYGVASFTLPSGTTVTEKPRPDMLYLKGDKNALKLTASYAFAAISGANGEVYTPVLTKGADGVATVSSLSLLRTFDGQGLYPDSAETSITFIYKSAHRILECEITATTLEENEITLCVEFSENTEEYKHLF